MFTIALGSVFTDIENWGTGSKSIYQWKARTPIYIVWFQSLSSQMCLKFFKITKNTFFWSFKICLSSVAQSGLTLCNPIDCSTPGLPVPSRTPRVYSNPCPSSRGCHPTISFSVIPFSSLLHLSQHQVFSSESALHIRWPKYWSFSFNISPSNEHPDWFPLGWTGWISLQSKGLSRVFSNTTVQKHQFSSAWLSL